jgi:tetratricopeptide (TPR) repeat protein
MYQRDFVLRMIEMIAELIAGILGLIRKGDYPKASQALENAYTDYLKEDAATLTSIPKEELTKQLLAEHHFTNGHLEILSELFFAQAELSCAKGKYTESLDFFEKSLILLEFLSNETDAFSIELQNKIQLRQEKIEQTSEIIGS